MSAERSSLCHLPIVAIDRDWFTFVHDVWTINPFLGLSTYLTENTVSNTKPSGSASSVSVTLLRFSADFSGSSDRNISGKHFQQEPRDITELKAASQPHKNPPFFLPFTSFPFFIYIFFSSLISYFLLSFLSSFFFRPFALWPCRTWDSLIL